MSRHTEGNCNCPIFCALGLGAVSRSNLHARLLLDALLDDGALQLFALQLLPVVLVDLALDEGASTQNAKHPRQDHDCQDCGEEYDFTAAFELSRLRPF